MANKSRIIFEAPVMPMMPLSVPAYARVMISSAAETMSSRKTYTANIKARGRDAFGIF